MGLSNNLADVSSDSIPIVLLISAVRGVSYLRYLVLCLLGLSQPSDPSSSPPPSVGSGLAGLAVLADHLASSRPMIVGPAVGIDDDGCVFCLDRLREGERVRRLPCCHVFHKECVDGWLFGEQMNWNCPLCRAAVVADERRADAERRIGAELVAWLSPY